MIGAACILLLAVLCFAIGLATACDDDQPRGARLVGLALAACSLTAGHAIWTGAA